MRKVTGYLKATVATLCLAGVMVFSLPVYADENNQNQTENTAGTNNENKEANANAANGTTNTNNAANNTDTQKTEVKKSGQWMQDAKGWWYKNPDGSATYGWKEIDSKWYYFDSTGYNKTGWVDSNGKWYYMLETGDYATGWRQDGGDWYYLDKDGVMKTGWMKSGSYWYYMNSSGVMETGWTEVDDKWYYFREAGEMAGEGWLNDHGTWYYMDENGAMTIGWVKSGEDWYLMQNTGRMAYGGWASYGGYWYYFNGGGVMQTGTVTVDGINYDLGASGGIADPAAQRAQSYSSATNYLILVNRSTHTVNVFQGSQGNWSTIKSFSCTDGVATPNGTFTLGGHTYHFGEEKGYTCWYATQITGDILFHSVLYVPNSMSAISDGRLGITASHGCIRLDINNAKWIYESLPAGTKVVIYQ